MNQRGNIPVIILVIVLLVITAGGAYYFGTQKNSTPLTSNQTISTIPVITTAPTPVSSPTIDPTSNWKTYTNDTYHYSLKIPIDWVIDQNNAKENNNGLVFINSRDYQTNEGSQVPDLIAGAQLEILSNSVPFSSYNDFIKYITPDKKEYPNNGKEIIVDGEKGMLWTTDNAFSIAGQKGYQISIFHNGHGYDMHLVSTSPQDTAINQILSTFKFTQ